MEINKRLEMQRNFIHGKLPFVISEEIIRNYDENHENKKKQNV